MPSLWEVLKTSKGLPAPDGFTALFARSLSDTYTLTEISGIPPLNLGEIVEIVDYTIYGNIYQAEGVSPDTPQNVVGSGDRTANLLKLKEDYTTDVRGVSVSIKNGALTLKGTATAGGGRHIYLSENIILSSGTYYVRGDYVSGLSYHIATVSDNISFNTSQTTSYTFTLTEETAVALGINVIAGVKYDATVNVMLNEGSTALPYEPYGYKIPVVTRGKNLINIIPFEATIGTGKAVIRNFLNSLNVGTYTVTYNTELLTRNDLTDNSIYGIRVLNESGNFELIPSWGSANIGTVKKISLKITITEDNKGKFTNVYFYGCGMFSVGVTGSANISDFQLELGTEATEYEPYHEPITTTVYLDKPLYKIGDYAEFIRYSGKSVERPIKELILTGDEDWFEYSLADTYRLSLSGNTGITGYGLSTHFKCVATTSELVHGSFVSGTNSSYFKYENSSLSDFKAYLKEQYAAGTPVKVYYVLAAPITEIVELPEIPTLDGTTVIDVDTEVKPSNMWVEYKSSISEYNPMDLRTTDNQVLYTADNEILQTRR